MAHCSTFFSIKNIKNEHSAHSLHICFDAFVARLQFTSCFSYLMLLQLFRNDFYENFPKGPQHDTYNFRVPDSLLPYQWWVVFEDITPRQTEALDIYVKHRRKRELGECTLIVLLSSNETKWWRTFQKKLAARWDEALQM